MKAESKEIKPRVGMVFSPPSVLTVHKLGFDRMEFQPAFPHSCLQGGQQRLSFFASSTVANDIVCVPLERHMRETAIHPGIKGIMQVEVGQQR
jgi:hypothetical protein